MLSLDIQKLIYLASETENTPELKKYWESKYQNLFEQGLFQINRRTLQNTLQEEKLDKPITPYGDLILLKHLDAGNNIDEVKLQNTIQTSVRFLDALISRIPFQEQTKKFVEEYRKIALGIADFDNYTRIKKTKIADEIDYIGNFVSSSAYRASESLAEEKGVMARWDSISQRLRPKPFEFWYNTKTGDIKNGLEMSEAYTQETVLKSDFRVLPRRNSDILLFSPTPAWQVWSDREMSGKINPLEMGSKKPTRKSTTEQVEPKDTNPDSTVQINKQPTEQTDESINKGFGKLSPASPSSMVENTNLQDLQNQNNSILPAQPSESESVIDSEIDSEVNLGSVGSNDDVPVIADSAESEVDLSDLENFETDSEDDSEGESLESNKPEFIEPSFQIGELVHIVDPSSAENSKVYQVIEYVPEAEELKYRLTGGHEGITQKVWSESELESVELLSILDKINDSQEQPKEIPNTLPKDIAITENIKDNVRALIVVGDQILVDPREEVGGFDLPGGAIAINQTIEFSLHDNLKMKYGLSADINEKYNFYYDPNDQENGQGQLNIVYLVGIDQEQMTHDLKWVSLEEASQQADYLGQAVQDYINLVNATDDHEADISDIQNGEVDLAGMQAHGQDLIADEKEQTPNLAEQEQSIRLKKLEEIVRTSLFGDVPVTVNYSEQGLDNLELDVQADFPGDTKVILEMVNLLLKYTQDGQLVSKELDQLSQVAGSSVLQKFLQMLSLTLKYAPKI